MEFGLAFFCGFWYFVSQSKLGYHLTSSALGTPLVIGFLLGIIFNDIPTGMIMGGTIQLLYLGIIATGGNLPADQSLAALIAIPVAMKGGMTAEMAVVLAVPFGVLGSLLDQVRRTVNSVFIHKADKYAEEGNADKIVFCNTVLPISFNFVLRFTPVFLAILLGSDIIDSFLNAVPEWFTHGLSVAGGILPAIGFAITIMVIGKKNLLPFFFIGFFLVQYLEINTMAAAVFGICIAILSMTMKEERGNA